MPVAEDDHLLLESFCVEESDEILVVLYWSFVADACFCERGSRKTENCAVRNFARISRVCGLPKTKGLPFLMQEIEPCSRMKSTNKLCAAARHRT